MMNRFKDWSQKVVIVAGCLVSVTLVVQVFNWVTPVAIGGHGSSVCWGEGDGDHYPISDNAWWEAPFSWERKDALCHEKRGLDYHAAYIHFAVLGAHGFFGVEE